MRVIIFRINQYLIARWPLLGHIAKPATASISLTIINLVTTIIIIRILGEHVYADFAIDMAVLTLVFLVLEVVPSSYVIFRLQDNYRWNSALVPQTILGTLLSMLIIAMLAYTADAFIAFSAWIFPYVIASALKRHIDISLQAHGRLYQFFAIETLAASLRLPILFIFIWVGLANETALWASLALGLLLSQSIWMLWSRATFEQLILANRREYWALLWHERREYSKYYLNVFLKRIRDSLPPLIAARLFADKAELAAFLLAYRGILAAMSQARLVESVLNHRKNQKQLFNLYPEQRFIIAAGTQLMCLVATVLLFFSAGIVKPPWDTVIILSCLSWPTTLMMQERARSHSTFDAHHVTQSLIAYILFLGIGVSLAVVFNYPEAWLFSVILLAADTASWAAITGANRRTTRKTIE
jgi:hypothetical protein